MIKIIDSNGGPLVMLERELLPYWGGTDNVGDVIARPGIGRGSEFASDYDRACKIHGWVASIQVHDSAGVVFWGDRLGLGLIRESDTTLLVVRPYYEIDDLEDKVRSIRATSPNFGDEFNLPISNKGVIIFDSAFPGTEIHGDFLEMDLLPGLYNVSTYEHAAQNAEMVIHLVRLK